MKQKLGLACTLVRSPELLLLDEPTVGVDPLSRRELWDIILKLVYEQGLTVLLSTSYLDEAERCGHIIVLHEGKVLLSDGLRISPGLGDFFGAISVVKPFHDLPLRVGHGPGLIGLRCEPVGLNLLLLAYRSGSRHSYRRLSRANLLSGKTPHGCCRGDGTEYRRMPNR
jgi:energy-coupling factor transporter ATP-binding protein EcfA2